MELDAAASIRDRRRATATGTVLAPTILFLLRSTRLHIEPATVALTGAAIGLLVTRVPIEQALAKLEWPTLFFFVGLFVMVGALEETGRSARWPTASRTSPEATGPQSCSGCCGSQRPARRVVDNIPFTTAMVPVVEELQAARRESDDAYWWALALGACFGGNADPGRRRRATLPPLALTERAGRPIGFMALPEGWVAGHHRLDRDGDRLRANSLRGAELMGDRAMNSIVKSSVSGRSRRFMQTT